MRVPDALAEVADLPGVFVRPGERVALHGNLRLGGEVDAYVLVDDEEALVQVLPRLRRSKARIRFIGGWSDLFAWDEGTGGVILRFGQGFTGVKAEAGQLFVGVAAPLARAGWAARQAGLEGLVALERFPGTLGSWIEEAGIAPFQAAVGTVRALTSKGVRDIPPNEWTEGATVVAVTFTGALPSRIKAPPPAGAVAALDGDLPRRMVQSGLAGLRLRGIRLAAEQPGVAVNLGDATPKDLDVVLRMVRDRLQRDHGMDFKSRLVPAGRSRREG